jgi:hypothetical protein
VPTEAMPWDLVVYAVLVLLLIAATLVLALAATVGLVLLLRDR